MVTTRQKEHAKRIFQATLDGFREATQNAPDAEKPRVEMICRQWQAIVDDGTAIDKLCDIENFEALVGYQREFNTNKLSLDQYIGKEMQRSAEIDLAVYLTRNHRGAHITRLVDNGQHKMPDFAVGLAGDTLYESKFLEVYSQNAVETKVIEGLNQIKEYAGIKGFNNPWGEVHIFTYDMIRDHAPMKVQEHIEQLVYRLKNRYSFPFKVALQVYCLAYYDYGTHNFK